MLAGIDTMDLKQTATEGVCTDLTKQSMEEPDAHGLD